MDDIVAAFDMDGTLADYDAGMFAALQELHSEYEPPLAFERMHNLPPVYERRRKLICKVPGFWINLKPFELGFNVLRGAVEAGFDIDILTKGPMHSPIAWKEKVEWCEKYLNTITPFGMNIVTNKGRFYGRVLVDDFIPYVQQWLKHRPRGLVIMPAHCYNEGFTHPNVIRYDGSNGNQVWDALLKAKNRTASTEMIYNEEFRNVDPTGQ